jgi:signal transduction histidine kinase
MPTRALEPIPPGADARRTERGALARKVAAQRRDGNGATPARASALDIHLEQLLAALRAVEDGDFSVRLAAPAASSRRGEDDGTPRILGEIARTFNSVLTNALKFTPRSGRVAVRLAELGGGAELRVCDTGQGIPASFLPHVFERFRQADSTSTRAHGGLGLGLALVRTLVELHGGTARVSSPGEGKGATFTVTLPRRPTAHAPAEPTTPPLPCGGAARAIRG